MEEKTGNKNEDIKMRRVGTFTFGFCMILFGILIIISQIWGFNIMRYVIRSWPILFIILGTETLYYAIKKNSNIKYDVVGIFLTGFLVLSGLFIGMVDYGINELMQNSDTGRDIINHINIGLD